MTDHLGYDKHDPAGRNTGNSRNGTRSKTVLTDVGPVETTVPRDRTSSFEPKIVGKVPHPANCSRCARTGSYSLPTDRLLGLQR